MPGATAQRFDVAAIKRAHPIAEVVLAYGVELCSRGRALVGRCPFHDDGGRTNLHVYPATQSWYCFRCALGGDVIDFGATTAFARCSGAGPSRPTSTISVRR